MYLKEKKNIYKGEDFFLSIIQLFSSYQWIIIITIIYFLNCIRYDVEQFAQFISNSMDSHRRRNRVDRKIRWIFYCNWAHSMEVNLVPFFKYILFGKAK
jgi:hypothetical protein